MSKEENPCTRVGSHMVLWNIYIRVFHKNMFFKKKISATHHASAWGLV